MARSTYIYVVVSARGTPLPEAVFTVKWEMEKWLDRIGLHDPSDYEIWRYHDGPWQHEHSPVRVEL